MIKHYTAFVTDPDDAQAAVQDIVKQLAPEENALKSTIGIVRFSGTFAETDILDLLCAALPFELVGCLSDCISMNGQHDDTALSLTMLTSDDVFWNVSTVDDLNVKTTEDIMDELAALFYALKAEEKPKLAIPFLPSLPHFSGNDLYDTIRTIDDPFLLFGMCALNIEGEHNANYVFAKGRLLPNMCALLSFYGNLEPKFYVDLPVIYDETYGDYGEITDVERSILKEINNLPALDYFKKQGLISEKNVGMAVSLVVVPVIVTFPNLRRSKVACSFIGVVEGTEYVYAARTVEQGCEIAFSYLDGDMTLTRMDALLDWVFGDNPDFVLAYSSIARSWANTNLFAEAEKFAEAAKAYEEKRGSPFKYSLAYAGGEISPVIDDDGSYINMPHNFTMIVCTF